MQRSDLKEQEYNELLQRIVSIILKKGLKATTMDSVASSLGMSKRTLYEIFDSKSEMIKEALAFYTTKSQEFATQAFANSKNVMEALFTIFKRNRDIIGNVNIEFYRDMDRLYKDKRASYDKSREIQHDKLLQMFNLGVEQGMFRPNIDYKIQSRIMSLQMEALKRIEELFPADITLLQVFDGVILGFLRSIASAKGMKILDELASSLETPQNQTQTI